MRDDSRTAVATRTRMRSSENKLAGKLGLRGWFCRRIGLTEATGFDPRHPSNGLQVYATNALGETYRVTGWTGADEPILSGGEGREFVGLFDYLFTIGPR